MDSLIKLLPDNIANQIAAGEVIQRPASVVKELVENAVDAGASAIQIIIKDAGRTLIQVIDDGKGMAPMDARMAFERHATSKIRSAEDLFQLTTLGFRGEALPSIAAVSEVTLQTRTKETPQGIKIVLEGSKEIVSEPVMCAVGANFRIRHLFYNVPARRKFLKSDDTEFRHILDEVQNVAAVRPSIAFTLVHNDQTILDLPAAPLRERIVGLFGRSRLSGNLLSVEAETELVTLRGYVSRAAHTRKRGARQFFFANERYMRHPYFHRMVMNAYGNMIPKGEQPEYFLFLSVDPASIDVNISPTKTEIKFSEETGIGSIVYSAVRKAVMQGNALPSLDFTDHPEEQIEIPVRHATDPALIGEPPVRSPFVEVPSAIGGLSGDLSNRLSGGLSDGFSEVPKPASKAPDVSGWEERNSAFESRRSALTPRRPGLSGDFETVVSSAITKSFPDPVLSDPYAVTVYDGNICLVHVRRAQFHIAYHALRKALSSGEAPSSTLLFPALTELGAKEAALLKEYADELLLVGFDISPLGGSAYSINAVPNGIPAGTEEELLSGVLEVCADIGRSSAEVLRDKIIQRVVLGRIRSSAFPASPLMARELLRQLFALPDYLVTASGKTILTVLTPKELATRFK